jgi:hypothetical protein
MLTAADGLGDGSEFLFEWDLQDIDLSDKLIETPEFSFQGSNYYIRLEMVEGASKLGCILYSVKTLNKPGRIHYRFDVVKRSDEIVVKSSQNQCELRELHLGWGDSNLVESATIGDHILKVKMWTSEYDFEYDLEDENITVRSIYLSFFIGDHQLLVILKKNRGG